MPNSQPQRPPAPAPDHEAWRLDRKVPLTVVLLVVSNLVGGVWFAASTSFTAAEHARRISVLEAKSSDQDKALRDLLLELRERLARIEASLREQNANRTNRN